MEMASDGQAASSPRGSSKQNPQAQDTMRTLVNQCMKEIMRPLVDRVVAAENHIEHIAQELLRGRENERVLAQHHESIERLEINIGELSETLVKQIQAGLDRVVKDAQRIEAESTKKFDALHDKWEKLELCWGKGEMQIDIYQHMTKHISDHSQLLTNTAAMNKLLSEKLEPGFDELAKDHQLLKDLHLALDKAHAETRKITDKTRKNLHTLMTDFDDHKEETKENFSHMHQKVEGLAGMNKNTNHRQDTMAEHLKCILANSRTTRAKMDSVFEVHETQVEKFKRMEKDYDDLCTSFKQIGKDMNNMFEEMEESKRMKDLEKLSGQKLSPDDKRKSFKEESMAFQSAQADKKKKAEEASGAQLIAKAIADLAKQVQKSDSDITDVRDMVEKANYNLNENVKRVGKYERFVTTVEIQVEKQEVQMNDVMANNRDMFSTINTQGKIITDTGRTVDQHGKDVSFLHQSHRSLNTTIGKLDEDVSLAHDYFTGLRSGFKDKVVDDLLPSPQGRSAMQELAALSAPAAVFGKPKKLPALQDKDRSSGNATAR